VVHMVAELKEWIFPPQLADDPQHRAAFLTEEADRIRAEAGDRTKSPDERDRLTQLCVKFYERARSLRLSTEER